MQGGQAGGREELVVTVLGFGRLGLNPATLSLRIDSDQEVTVFCDILYFKVGLPAGWMTL